MTELRAYDFTAVFTVLAPVDATEEQLTELLAEAQEHFDNQWRQTGNSDTAWTVTIHAEDPIEYEQDKLPCGCTDYHMADCPIRTDTQQDPPEPDDDFDPARLEAPDDCPGCEWRGFIHRHNDAEDGPRKGCCEHTCSDHEEGDDG